MEKMIYYFESIESTNLTLKELARQNAPAGTFVTAKNQTAGKGRLGRSFYSPSGTGLYLSVLYRPNETDVLSLTTRAAAAAVRSIESVCKVSPGIKWVNDLFLNHRKIAGILAEGITENNHMTAVVLGIGINLWEPDGGYPSELANIAGSIFGQAKPDPVMHQALTDALITHLYPLQDGPEMLEIYRRHSIVTGRNVTLSDGIKKQCGRVLGFTESGALILETEKGSREVIRSGEITLRLQNSETF